MKLVFEWLPPLILIFVGSVVFALTVGSGMLGVILAVLCLLGLVVVCLMMGRSPFFERRGSWMLVLLLVPVVGCGIATTVQDTGRSMGMAYAETVRAELEKLKTESGHYPQDLSDVSSMDLRRHFVVYSSDGKAYQFYLYANFPSSGLIFTNKIPKWHVVDYD